MEACSLIMFKKNFHPTRSHHFRGQHHQVLLTRLLKFRFYKKATKSRQNLHQIWHVLHSVKSAVKILSIFVAKKNYRELFINLWLPSGKIVNFIHGKNEFWQKLDFRGIVPCRACDQVMTIPSFKGQAHDMFSRIFRTQGVHWNLFDLTPYKGLCVVVHLLA